jgi:hypothetical protein
LLPSDPKLQQQQQQQQTTTGNITTESKPEKTPTQSTQKKK